ncbi:hypothetical protein F1737_00255 [Methanoplanus sp. FWC-SCC4]|uniref:Uncharacterized protein n=1 Tax=Methanochimaera problematica TaxID=2609417 RepID=A0AA97FD09_9EURY|nr:hypothetical protein [Methanoplanus sp. FWC-SCC4]WOF15216.1 hypothetical protein F1737_00255 [Methanoplanus sp. FWC-SCC4]
MNTKRITAGALAICILAGAVLVSGCTSGEPVVETGPSPVRMSVEAVPVQESILSSPETELIFMEGMIDEIQERKKNVTVLFKVYNDAVNDFNANNTTEFNLKKDEFYYLCNVVVTGEIPESSSV